MCLDRVAFGNSSSLKRIGVKAFSQSALVEIRIPGRVEELGDECFTWSRRGEDYLGMNNSCGRGLSKIYIPNSVGDLARNVIPSYVHVIATDDTGN